MHSGIASYCTVTTNSTRLQYRNWFLTPRQWVISSEGTTCCHIKEGSPSLTRQSRSSLLPTFARYTGNHILIARADSPLVRTHLYSLLLTLTSAKIIILPPSRTYSHPRMSVSIFFPPGFNALAQLVVEFSLSLAFSISISLFCLDLHCALHVCLRSPLPRTC